MFIQFFLTKYSKIDEQERSINSKRATSIVGQYARYTEVFEFSSSKI